MLSVDHKIVQFNANSDYDIYMYITSLKNCYRYKFNKKIYIIQSIFFLQMETHAAMSFRATY